MNFRNMGSDGKDGRPPAGPGNLPLQAEPPLMRLPSVYSWTLNEFQTTLGGFGKDFGSMNMDEFLKNIWTAEETHAMASGMGMGGAEGGVSGGMGLQRQGSLTLPRTLSQKTVDEVWKDLSKENGAVGLGDSNGFNLNPQQREPTLGEMTLEEFLVRAGVVREDFTQSAQRPIISTGNINSNNINNGSVFYGNQPSPNTNNNPGIALDFGSIGRSNAGVVPHTMTNSSTTNLTMNVNGVRPSYNPPMQLGNELTNSQGIRGGGGIMGIGDPVANSGLMMQGMVGLGAGGVKVAATGSPAKSNGDLSSLSPVPYVFNGGLSRRKCSGAVEKVVERRQRRMIKNRESAARSRARKQAYTMELEAEIATLKERNQELEKEKAEILEMQKNEIMQMMEQQCGPKRRCLRRTRTGPW